MSVEDDFGIGSIYAVDVAIDFTGFRAQGTGEGDGGHIGTAAAECRDLVAVTGALKSGDNDDFAFFEFILNSVGTDGDDACVGVGIVCDDAGLTACKADGFSAVFLNGNREKRHRRAFARTEQHIEFTRWRLRHDAGCLA